MFKRQKATTDNSLPIPVEPSSVTAMTTVQQLLAQKGREVLSVRPEDTVYDAIKKMADENVGSLVRNRTGQARWNHH